MIARWSIFRGGKSKLLRALAGLQPALAGDVRIKGESLAALSAGERARRVAVVLTERVTSPGMLVRDVVSMGSQPFTGWLGQLGDPDHAAVTDALALSGAGSFADRRLDAVMSRKRIDAGQAAARW